MLYIQYVYIYYVYAFIYILKKKMDTWMATPHSHSSTDKYDACIHLYIFITTMYTCIFPEHTCTHRGRHPTATLTNSHFDHVHVYIHIHNKYAHMDCGTTQPLWQRFIPTMCTFIYIFITSIDTLVATFHNHSHKYLFQPCIHVYTYP